MAKVTGTFYGDFSCERKERKQAMTIRPEHGSCSFDDFLRELTFDFFGSGQHKVTAGKLLLLPNAVLLDVRSVEEVQTLVLPFSNDLTTLHIPTNEIPDRLGEIPKDRPVAVFCSAGTRSAIVYAYLRTMGFEQARVLVGGYPDLTEQAKPGEVWKRLNARRKGS